MAPRKRATKSGETLANIHIKLSADLKAKLELAAAREGLDVSSFARNLMIRRARELGIDI